MKVRVELAFDCIVALKTHENGCFSVAVPFQEVGQIPFPPSADQGQISSYVKTSIEKAIYDRVELGQKLPPMSPSVAA